MVDNPVNYAGVLHYNLAAIVSCFLQRSEPVLVQAITPELVVKTFHKSILSRFTGVKPQFKLKEMIAARLNKYELEHTTIELKSLREACRDDPDKSISLYSIYRQLGVELMKIL